MNNMIPYKLMKLGSLVGSFFSDTLLSQVKTPPFSVFELIYLLQNALNRAH
jgi:hypothetical protein